MSGSGVFQGQPSHVPSLCMHMDASRCGTELQIRATAFDCIRILYDVEGVTAIKEEIPCSFLKPVKGYS